MLKVEGLFTTCFTALFSRTPSGDNPTCREPGPFLLGDAGGGQFTPDGVLYDLTDWRDPFVFGTRLRGVVDACGRKGDGENGAPWAAGLCASMICHHWELQEPFYAPHLTPAPMECPDLFRMGDWYYLIYSQYTDRFKPITA